ncbi:MAG: hypothetical protein ACK5N1_02320 [Gemmatimonas sp.]
MVTAGGIALTADCGADGVSRSRVSATRIWSRAAGGVRRNAPGEVVILNDAEYCSNGNPEPIDMDAVSVRCACAHIGVTPSSRMTTPAQCFRPRIDFTLT